MTLNIDINLINIYTTYKNEAYAIARERARPKSRREVNNKEWYNKIMDKQLETFSNKFSLNFFTDVEEIEDNFEGFMDEYPGVTSIVATPDFHDFFIIGLVKDGELYRLGNEDFDPDEDPNDLILVTIDELEDFYTTLFPEE